MMQSTYHFERAPVLHVAIIMDGNGRWAMSRGLPRLAGHRAGADALRRTVEAAPGCGIRTLTVYAFSSDNWKRPRLEVAGLMTLLGEYLAAETPECAERGVRISVIGRRDRLPTSLVASIDAAERTTAECRSLHLRLAIDYSAREDILRVLSSAAGQPMTRECFEQGLGGGAPVDLLIRTGGEQRLSDFLLWESAYAELIFSSCMWPDFTTFDLKEAVKQFSKRERRYGAIPQPHADSVEHWLR